MKRYLAFAGSNYYPAGGWKDYRGDFDTVEEAVLAIANISGIYWWHIVDTTIEDVVANGERK